MKNFFELDRNKLYNMELSIRDQAFYRQHQKFALYAYRDAGIKSGIYFLLGMFIVEGILTPLVKVGYTVNLKKRWQRISTTYRAGDNPSDMYVIHFVPIFAPISELRKQEALWHYKFISFRVRGEWFSFKPVAELMGWDYNSFFTAE